MAGTSRSLRWAGRVVAAASWLVPGHLRADWRAEWRAELVAWSGDGRDGLVSHAAGAFADAAWLRQRHVVDVVWLDDLRHGWRQVREHGGFAAIAIGVLAIGMAASITAFSVVSQVLLRPLPYPESERVVTVWERQVDSSGRQAVSPGNFLDWRERATSFEFLAGAEPFGHDYMDGERPEMWQTANVTQGFFESFSVAPRLGRWFTPEEFTAGRQRVVMLSARLWHSRFASDPGVVGRRIILGDERWEIVGVMPDDFQPHLFEDRPGTLLAWTPKVVQESEARVRGNGYWAVVGRLTPGVSLEQARADMDRVAAQIEAEQPRTNRGSRAAVLTIREHLVGDVRPAVRLFVAAVAVVLLIACVNVANLLLARGSSRAHELAVRSALGASRWRLLGQLLVECSLLATLAALAGLGLATGATRALAALGPADVLWLDTLHVDWRAAVFAAALGLVVTMLAGIVPALRLSAVGRRGDTRTTTGERSQRRLRAGLVAVEVALALVLVSGTALLLRSFVNLANVDAGFTRAGVAVLQVFAWDRNPGPDALRGFFDAAIGRLAALPGVDAAGAVSAMPFIEANFDMRHVFHIVGDPPPPAGAELRGSFNVATPGYFQAMGIRTVRGRALDDHDRHDSAPVAVVSEAFAERYFRGRDPIGRRVAYRHQGRPTEVEIVGVTAALRHQRLDEAPRAELFRPFAQTPSGSMTLVAHSPIDARALIESAKHAVWAIDPLQTFYSTSTIDELVGRTMATRRFVLLVLAAFGALALLLAAAGLYGVVTAIAMQQRREIGVRLALGARWADVMRLVLARGLVVVVVVIVAGTGGAFGAGRLLASFLYGVSPSDPWAIGGAAFLMFGVAVPACLLPATRAAATDPVEVLRPD